MNFYYLVLYGVTLKISILSDLHLGYGWNTELEEDSFQNATEAVEKCLDSDLVLLAGDVFDRKIPRTGVLAKALKILSKLLLVKPKKVKLVKTIGKKLKKISERTLKRTPVIALHGTHERRTKDQINAIQALEETGFLIHLHCNSIVFEKDGQKVAVHGMSGVPERYAKGVLDKWNPKPVKGCYNILMLHQSIDPFIYSPLDPPTISLDNLPKGFDLVVAGHIHISGKTKFDKNLLVFPGSMIATQLKKEESESDKGLYQVTLPKKKVEFVKLENNRKFFYREVKIDKSVRNKIEEEVDKILKKKFEKKPLIRLKIKGKDVELMNKELKDIRDKYSDKAILRFSKEVEASEIMQRMELLEKIREEQLSPEELGFRLLEERLEKLRFKKQFDAESMFRLFADGRTEQAFNILIGEQKTLAQIMKGDAE